MNGEFNPNDLKRHVCFVRLGDLTLQYVIFGSLVVNEKKPDIILFLYVYDESGTGLLHSSINLK